MVIKTEVQINGTSFKDYKSLKIEKSISKYGSTGQFKIVYDSPWGRHKGDFSVGDDVKIYADQNADPTTLLFRGIIDEVIFDGKGTRQRVTLHGRDYSAKLQDVTVEPVVYTNSEISDIVKNIIQNEVPEITTTNVNNTGVTLKRIAFNHVSVYDALKKLADLSGFIFFVDENKDLHFERASINSSGVTLSSSNIKSMDFYTSKEDFANQVWVYGDRTLTGFKEVIQATGGSSYTLTYRPHNTQIESSAKPGSLLKGGVFELVGYNTSGPDFLVSFFDRKVIFVSGNVLGYNSIPPSGGSFIAIYDREVPIVKFGEDDISIKLFGPKEKVIIDKSIKDPQTARDRVKLELEKSNPLNKIECDLDGWFTFKPGQTVVVNLPDFNINNKTSNILSITYDFTPENLQSEQVIRVKLDNKIMDITDNIKSIEERLRALEASDAADIDLITRLKFSLGSVLVVGSYWETRIRPINDSYILGHPING